MLPRTHFPESLPVREVSGDEDGSPRREEKSDISKERVVKVSMSQGTIPSPMNACPPSFESCRITSLQQPLKELNERKEEVFHDPCTKRRYHIIVK
jgi:hypothetical protein